MAFSTDQARLLATKLNGKHVRTRTEGETTLSYVEGWHVVAEANRIFGFEGWDRETLNTKCVWETLRRGQHHCAYSAQVRIRVRAGETLVARDGNGVGLGANENPGLAHERALKEAETDATKRALATFGNVFGLALYDKDQAGVSRRGRNGRSGHETYARGQAAGVGDRKGTSEPLAPPLPIVDGEGRIISRRVDPRAVCKALRELIDGAQTLTDLEAMWRENQPTLRDLRRLYPALVTTKGKHFADILADLFAQRRGLLRSTNANGRLEPPADIEQRSVSAPAERPDSTSVSSEVHMVDPPTTTGAANMDQPSHDLPRHPETMLESSGGVPGNGATAEPEPVATKLPAAIVPRLPRRIRDREHRRFVARQPCLLCGRSPSHPHHLRFAQPRALGLKPGDEWVVPLCRIHHRALHLAGDERQWWAEHTIDPIPEAQRLWDNRWRIGGANNSPSADEANVLTAKGLAES